MKISARNVLKGKITKVVKGATTSHIFIEVNGATVTSSITNEAVDDLKLKPEFSDFSEEVEGTTIRGDDDIENIIRWWRPKAIERYQMLLKKNRGMGRLSRTFW